MGFLIATAVFIFGFVAAQDPDCDYVQRIGPNEGYSINNNYSGGRTCRYHAICSRGYNCRADCSLNMPSSTNCQGDRLLISETGDVTLTAARAYCGRRSVSAVSTSTNLTIGLVSVYNSPGGQFRCDLTSQQEPTTPAPICVCGVRKMTRIVGGQETRPNEYTMMAAIIDNSIESIYCGGTIISNRYVMSAAHCLYPYRNNPRGLSVVAGIHDIDNLSSGTTYSISRFIIHERYNPNTYDYDIALIETLQQIVFNENVLPACLPFKFTSTDLTNKVVTVLGWGTTSFGGQTAERLRKVDVNVISQTQCQSTEGSNVGSRQLCTYARGKDSCQFDSGGPALYTDPSNGLLFSVGVISNGNICASGRPGINTRVTALLQWVVNNANSNFCRIR